MSNSSPSYQLTKHPVGSLKEIWTLSWPLMLSLMSGSFMIFVDRLFLAHYNIEAMNALPVAGLAEFLTLILAITICEITEVFVGRFHGEQKYQQLGKPVWQMIWFSLLYWPLNIFFARVAGAILFDGNSLEMQFLLTRADFATPAILMSITLMGFFIAIGKSKVITISTILANVLNACLAPLFIFGNSIVPEMGIKGTALATTAAQWFQCLMLAFLFLREKYRSAYHTHAFRIDKTLFLDMWKVGVPSSLGRMVEIMAHCLYFKIMALAGKEALTCATIVQSFFILVMFTIDGTAKSATAITSNLFGANKPSLIPSVLRSAFRLHAIFFALVGLVCYIGLDLFLPYFLGREDHVLMQNSEFLFAVKLAAFWMCLMFLFDGFAWITAGFLTAAKDTKFIFYMNVVTSCFTYLLPLYLIVTYAGGGGASGWAVIACNSLCLLAVFLWRAKQLIPKTIALSSR